MLFFKKAFFTGIILSNFGVYDVFKPSCLSKKQCMRPGLNSSAAGIYIIKGPVGRDKAKINTGAGGGVGAVEGDSFIRV